MATITVILILLALIIASSALTRMLPVAVPTPLVQIALGVALTLCLDVRVELQPEVFFLLYLPPLLFLDGWRIPKEDLLRDKGTIIELALGLVLFTVIGVGFFIHWMIPSMPMAVAFALAAIVSPTDPIAVSAITSRVPIPKRLMHILEGESLLNDASGLVCMRFAVAAALTGTFSVLEASLTFMWLAAAGIGIGIAVTWVVGRISLALIRRIGEDPSAQILLTVIIPFAAYLLAEHVHASGILAAVAAGITVSYMGASSPAIKAETRIRGVIIWDAIAFTANGAIFIILGAQLPDIASGAVDIVRSTGHHEPVWLLLYALAINIGLVSLRLLWVWISLRFTLYREARRGNAFKAPSWRLIVATSLAGVRGTITLAGILTLPLFMNDGSPFPARDLAIFLAATTIIISLLVASIGLPRLLKGLELPPEPSYQEREDTIRVAAAEAAIAAIDLAQNDMDPDQPDRDLYIGAASRIMDFYRQRIEQHQRTGDDAAIQLRADDIERRLGLVGVKAQRRVLQQFSKSKKSNSAIDRKLTAELDLMEKHLS